MIEREEMKKMTWEEVLDSEDSAVLGQALYELFQESLNTHDLPATPYTEDAEPVWAVFAEKLRANLTLLP